ncbi:MAG TPA: glycosyltransferase family 9 protein [Fimbriimonadaceae bacterium]|jgi:lipopolysaccharide heptosyltransferase I
MRLLISRLSSLGDVVCSLPAAVALKNAFPGCSISWVVSKKFSAIVRACSAVDTVIEAKKGLKLSDWPQLAEAYDCALDLQGLFKSAWPIHLARASRKLGYHWQREGSFLFSSRVLPDPTSFHIVDQYADVARAAGGQMDGASFDLTPEADALAGVRTILGNEGVTRFVALNPGAAWASKRWPEEHCAAFIDALETRVVLIGGSSEEELAISQRISTACKKSPAILTGKTNIAELVALLSLAEAHVGGDTGSTHISAALGKPSVGLYSITNPRRSCPYGQIENCFYEPKALSSIDPVAVSGKVKELIA